MAMRREQEGRLHPGLEMHFRRLLIVPLVAAALLVTAVSGYSVQVVTAAQKERSAHFRKPTKFHYVCPMHEDITSTKSGTCPKCNMKLVKKPVPQEPAQ